MRTRTSTTFWCLLSYHCNHFYTNAQKLQLKWKSSMWDRKPTREIPKGLIRSWTRVSRVSTQRFPHSSSKAPFKSTKHPTCWWEWSKPLSSHLGDQNTSVYSKSPMKKLAIHTGSCTVRGGWSSERCVQGRRTGMSLDEKRPAASLTPAPSLSLASLPYDFQVPSWFPCLLSPIFPSLPVLDLLVIEEPGLPKIGNRRILGL